MDEIMVSIVCIAYNHEPYIRDCLEGFVNQKTNFKFEVLVHDDASTDKTADIIREYESKYPDIFKPIYQKENQYSQGVKFGKKYIYPKLRGKYVAWCEGDDYWCDENKLQKQFDFMEAHPEYSACVHNTCIKNLKTGTEKPFCDLTEDGNMPIERIITMFGGCFHTTSVLTPVKYTEYPEEFNVQGVGDYPRALYLAAEGQIYYFADIMSVYRVWTEGSWTQRMAAGKRERLMQYRKNTFEMLSRFDKYYDYRYHEPILKRQVELLQDSFEFRTIFKNAAYRKVYLKNSNVKKKLLLISGCLFPNAVKHHFNKG